MKCIHVVAAVIRGDACGRPKEILISKRLDHVHQGGKWEFPGGKVEATETPEAALIRELKEELNIYATKCLPLIQIQHDYPDKSVFLDVWDVLEFENEPKGMEGQLVEWAPVLSLNEYEFPAANVPIVAAAMLPTGYWITPEPEGDSQKWLTLMSQKLAAGVRLIQLRVKAETASDLKALTISAAFLVSKSNASLFINGDSVAILKTAGLWHYVKNKVDGIHLTSKQLAAGETFNGELALAASCHQQEDLKRAEDLGCVFATLSPIKPTDSHPGAVLLKPEQALNWLKYAKLPVYALGGLSNDDVPEMKLLGFQGVAGIRHL